MKKKTRIAPGLFMFNTLNQNKTTNINGSLTVHDGFQYRNGDVCNRRRWQNQPP